MAVPGVFLSDVGAGRDGSDGVSGLLVVRHPVRRHRRDMRGQSVDADAGDAVALRAYPVAHLAAGRSRPSRRMAPRHRRLPQPAVTVIPHGAGRDRAGFTGAEPAARVARVPAPAQAAGQRVAACLTRPQGDGEPPGPPRIEMYGSIPHVRPIHRRNLIYRCDIL